MKKMITLAAILLCASGQPALNASEVEASPTASMTLHNVLDLVAQLDTNTSIFAQLTLFNKIREELNSLSPEAKQRLFTLKQRGLTIMQKLIKSLNIQSNELNIQVVVNVIKLLLESGDISDFVQSFESLQQKLHLAPKAIRNLLATPLQNSGNPQLQMLGTILQQNANDALEASAPDKEEHYEDIQEVLDNPSTPHNDAIELADELAPDSE